MDGIYSIRHVRVILHKISDRGYPSKQRRTHTRQKKERKKDSFSSYESTVAIVPERLWMNRSFAIIYV